MSSKTTIGTQPAGTAPTGAEGARRLVRQHDLAMELGVTDKRIATWRSRSAVNGFPEPVACQNEPPKGGGRRGAFLWDLGEVFEWFERYDVAAQQRRSGAKRKGVPQPKRSTK